MALEISGKLIKILNPQTGTGKNGPWQKQEFVIETPDQFPKKVCISAWGEKADDLKKFSPGDNLKISLNLESREYNEKWYTEARAWRIEAEGAAPSGSGNSRPAPAASGDDFGFEPYTPSSKSASEQVVEDDLPF
jgi:hypothetical protein